MVAKKYLAIGSGGTGSNDTPELRRREPGWAELRQNGDYPTQVYKPSIPRRIFDAAVSLKKLVVG